MKWHGIDVGAKIRNSSNILKSASLSSGVITFTRGDDTTTDINVGTGGGSATTYRVALQSNYYDNTTGSPKRFMPFNSLSEQGSAGTYLTVVPAFNDGKVLGAAIWTQGSAGECIFGLHINSSLTAAATDTQTCSAGEVTIFTLSTNNTFSQGDEIGFSLDPTAFPYGVSAQIIIEYDI